MVPDRGYLWKSTAEFFRSLETGAFLLVFTSLVFYKYVEL